MTGWATLAVRISVLIMVFAFEHQINTIKLLKPYYSFMKITLLGTGVGIPQRERVQSGVLVDTEGSLVLFDCGCGVLGRIYESGHDHKGIDAIVLTHLHLDHVGMCWHSSRPTGLWERQTCRYTGRRAHGNGLRGCWMSMNI